MKAKFGKVIKKNEKKLKSNWLLRKNKPSFAEDFDKERNTPLKIIWDITSRCPWDCKICCMDASKESVKCSSDLSIDQKYKIIDDIALLPFPVSIDFSGGEVFIEEENIDVILYASKLLGAKNIGISTSGAFAEKYISKLIGKVNDIELTLDSPSEIPLYYRPKAYHATAEKSALLFKENGFKVGLQTVLTTETIKKPHLEKLINRIVDLGVDEWSLLRFFPSGRGADYSFLIPNETDLIAAVEWIKKQCPKSLKVSPHYSFNSCLYCERAGKKSIGIYPDGSATGCFWAIDKHKNISEKFNLGSLKNHSIREILSGPKMEYLTNHCFSCYINEKTMEKAA